MEVTHARTHRISVLNIRLPGIVSRARDTRPPPTAMEIANRYRDAVWRYVAHRVDGAAQAEDVAAEVFAAAFQNLARCPTPPGPDKETDAPDLARAYLLGIARRKIADHYRSRTRRPETPLDATHEIPAPPWGADAPEHALLHDEAGRTIRQLVQQLAPDYRDVLLLKYVEEYSTAEIARILGRSEAATNSLLQRARARALAQGRHYFLDEEGTEAR